MSLKRNIFVSYASHIYVTLIGIVMVPFYLKYMGVEAYGLVGFFVMLQAWFQLLDMGLTPTMARETARFQGGGTDAFSLRRLLRALEGVFVVVALLGAALLIVGAPQIAAQWLKVQQLPLPEVERALMLMALIVALRWVCGLYRGAVNGFERLVWLGGFNAVIATSRFVLVIPLFIYVGASPTHFFGFQLAVAIVELTVLVAQTYHLLPKVKPLAGKLITPWDWAPLRGVLKFSLSIAFTSSVWVLVTQTDKLLLSKILPLAEYGYFTLAVLVAGGILTISTPISSAVMPRMVRQEADGDHAGVIRLYRESTQIVVIVTTSVTVILALFAEPILWAWTGNKELAHQVAPVLILYAIGNCLMAVSGMAYLLQYAKGNLRMHLIGSSGFVIILIPSMIWSASYYGVKGVGFVWLSMSVIYFFAWVPLVHRMFQQGLHKAWLLKDVIRIFTICGLTGLLLYLVPFGNESRPWFILKMVIFGVMTLLAGVIGSTAGWSRIKLWMGRK